MPRILVIEDSLEEHELIRRALRDEHELIFALSGEAGVGLALTQRPDLVLLDVGLPDCDGFACCAQLKSNPLLADLPIVFLTGRVESSDKVMAFKLGAEDYIEKPFDPAELRARIEVRLRSGKSGGALLSFSDMQLDALRHEVVLRLPDREWTCDLTPHEFRILSCLAARRGSAMPRAQLIEAAWGGVTVSDRTVDSHVSNLRRKLEPHGDRLQSVRGIGYRLAEPVPDA